MSTPPRAWIKQLIGIYLIWAVLVSGAATYAVSRVHAPLKPDIRITAVQQWAQTFTAFDSKYYYAIATTGYPDHIDSSNVFYPLFPAASWALSHLGIPVLLAGLAINFLAAGIAFVFFGLLARDYLEKNDVALNAAVLWLFFPTAFFLTMFYTEALFCALLFAAFYYGSQRRWWLVGVLLALLTAVRLPGLVAVAALLVEYTSTKDFAWRKVDRQILWFALAPLGWLAYAVFLFYRVHDPLAMIHAYQLGAWPYMHFSLNIPGTVWHQLVIMTQLVFEQASGWQESLFNVALPFGCWLGAVVVTAWGYKKIPLSYLTFMVLSLILFALNSNFVSVNRYALTFFPVFLLLGRWFAKRPQWYGLALGGSAVLMGIWLLLFVNGYFVA